MVLGLTFRLGSIVLQRRPKPQPSPPVLPPS